MCKREELEVLGDDIPRECGRRMHADDILHWAVACWAWFLPSLISSSAVEVPRLGPHEAETGECNVSGSATGRCARGPVAWQKGLFTVRRDAAGAMPRWHVGIRSRFTRPVATRISPGEIQLRGGRGAFRGGPMEGDGEHSM